MWKDGINFLGIKTFQNRSEFPTQGREGLYYKVLTTEQKFAWIENYCDYVLIAEYIPCRCCGK